MAGHHKRVEHTFNSIIPLFKQAISLLPIQRLPRQTGRRKKSCAHLQTHAYSCDNFSAASNIIADVVRVYVLKQGDLQDDIFVYLVNELRAQLGWKGRNDFTLVKHRFRHEHVIVEGTDLPAGLRIHFFRLFGAKKKPGHSTSRLSVQMVRTSTMCEYPGVRMHETKIVARPLRHAP